MPAYKMIGADGAEYGPVTADHVIEWIKDGRADEATQVQSEDGGGWKPLKEFAEFAPALGWVAPTHCPTCGELFETNFDSCWKCGTGKDGTRPKAWSRAEDATNEPLDPCPGCGSRHISRGRLVAADGGSVVFRPEGLPFFTLFEHGFPFASSHTFACLHCGLVWNHVDPTRVQEFTKKAKRGAMTDQSSKDADVAS